MSDARTAFSHRAFWNGALRSGAVFALALAIPVWAAAQAPAEPAPPPAEQPPAQTQPEAQPPAQPQTQPSAQPQTQPSNQGSTQPAPAASKEPAPLPQQDNPKVKAGTEADVNAIGNRGVGKGVNFYSLESEIALGKGYAQEVERSAKLIDDPVVTEYVNRVGQNLVRNSDAKVPFTIKVIDTDVVNAMALPGGFFYVNSGLILRADSEAELAGVMAHEIAHVAARHGTRNQTKGEIAQLATIPLIMLGPGGWAGYGLYEGLNFAVPMSFLKFSRDAEHEADYLGLQYMYKTGYDPNAFVTFFEKIEADEKHQPGTIPEIILDASAHARSRGGHPEGDRGRSSRARSVHRHDVGIRHRQGAAAQDREPRPAGLQQERRRQADPADTHGAPTARTSGSGGGSTQPQTTADPNSDPDRPTLHKRAEDDPNSDSQ